MAEQLFLVKTCKPGIRTVNIDGVRLRLPFPYAMFLIGVETWLDRKNPTSTPFMSINRTMVYFSLESPSNPLSETHQFIPLPLPNIDSVEPDLCMGEGFNPTLNKGTDEPNLKRLLDQSIAWFWNSRFSSLEHRGPTTEFCSSEESRIFMLEWCAGGKSLEWLLKSYPKNIKHLRHPKYIVTRYGAFKFLQFDENGMRQLS